MSLAGGKAVPEMRSHDFVCYSHHDAEWLKRFETIFSLLREYAEVDFVVVSVRIDWRPHRDSNPAILGDTDLHNDKQTLHSLA